MKKQWDVLEEQAASEERLPVLFAMFQTLREVINEDLPDEAKQDISFPVELEDGNTKVYKSYKEFLDDCQRGR